MLNVLSHNPSKTVGLVDGGNPASDLIGEFNPKYLKEWAEQIIEHFGTDNPVFISVRKSMVSDTNALVASDSLGDPLQVMVVGLEKEKIE
jgi:hypothetical protein